MGEQTAEGIAVHVRWDPRWVAAEYAAERLERSKEVKRLRSVAGKYYRVARKAQAMGAALCEKADRLAREIYGEAGCAAVVGTDREGVLVRMHQPPEME
jgi:hypothetical protein